MSALLAQILAYVLQILGVDQAIQAQVNKLLGIMPDLGNVARESAEFNIEDIVLGNSNILTNSTYGLAAINTSVNLVPGIIQGTGLHTIADILAAIGAIPVYTLPDTPPPGYGTYVPGNVNVPQICALD